MPVPKKCDSCSAGIIGDKWYPVLSGGKLFYFCHSCASKFHEVITALGGEENEL